MQLFLFKLILVNLIFVLGISCKKSQNSTIPSTQTKNSDRSDTDDIKDTIHSDEIEKGSDFSTVASGAVVEGIDTADIGSPIPLIAPSELEKNESDNSYEEDDESKKENLTSSKAKEGFEEHNNPDSPLDANSQEIDSATIVGASVAGGIVAGAAVGASIGGILEWQKFKPKDLASLDSIYIENDDPNYKKFVEMTKPGSSGIMEQRKLNVTSDKPRVTIVGGGPVGLLSAIEAYQNGAKQVVLVEARPDYSRQVVLRIDQEHLERIKNIVGVDEFRKLIDNGVIQPFSDEISKNPHGASKMNPDGSITGKMAIRIQNLEKILASAVENIAKQDPQAFKVLYGYKFEAEDGHKVTSDGRQKLVLKKENTKGRGPNTIELETDWLVGADSGSSQVKRLGGIETDLVSSRSYAGIAVYKNPDSNRFAPGTYEITKLSEFYKSDLDGYKGYMKSLGFSDLELEGKGLDEAVKRKNPSVTIDGMTHAQKLDELLPRTRLFIMNDVIQIASEFSESQWKNLNPGDNQSVDRMKQYYKDILAKHFGPTVADNFELVKGLNMSSFPVELERSKNFWQEVQGGRKNLQVFVIGDAAASTHFFTGSGVNRGFDDSTLIGKAVKKGDSWVRAKYNRKVSESVENMHGKSLGNKGAGAPPDSLDGRRLVNPLDEIKVKELKSKPFKGETQNIKGAAQKAAGVGAIGGAIVGGAAATIILESQEKGGDDGK